MGTSLLFLHSKNDGLGRREGSRPTSKLANFGRQPFCSFHRQSHAPKSCSIVLPSNKYYSFPSNLPLDVINKPSAPSASLSTLEDVRQHHQGSRGLNHGSGKDIPADLHQLLSRRVLAQGTACLPAPQCVSPQNENRNWDCRNASILSTSDLQRQNTLKRSGRRYKSLNLQANHFQMTCQTLGRLGEKKRASNRTQGIHRHEKDSESFTNQVGFVDCISSNSSNCLIHQVYSYYARHTLTFESLSLTADESLPV